MNNWALVVGIDVYDEKGYELDGSVSDALRFLDWCVAADGGGVAPANVNLLLDPQPGKFDPARLPAGVAYRSAVKNNFTRGVVDFLTRSNSNGDRCFFYFAGHGITARVNGADIPCICLRDFGPVLTTNAVSLPSIFARFRAARFAEQYFLIDACRNIPFTSEFEVSNFDRPAQPIANPSPQFVAYATQPRNTAAELQTIQYIGGVFTQSLLGGLKGQAAAKQWDGVQGKYIVRWNTLFKFVEQTVLTMKVPSPVPGKTGVVQAPKQYGERGSEDPILATFAEGVFAREKLRVSFTPDAAGPEVSLTLGEYGEDNRVFAAPLAPLPWEIELPPRIYSVVAKATRYQSKQKMSLAELFSTLPLTIEMISTPPVPPPVAATTDTAGKGIVFRGILSESPTEEFVTSPDADIDDLPGSAPPTPAAPRDVNELPSAVAVADDLAQLEIVDTAGRFIITGRGTVSLPPTAREGLFRVRTMGPDGAFNETLVELSPTGLGQPAHITLPTTVMTPGLLWATQPANIGETSEGLLQPSEAVGPAAFFKLSTLLALAAGARAEATGNAWPGQRLRNVPLPPSDLPAALQSDTGALQILLGDELLAADWSGSRVALCSQATPDSQSDVPIKLGPGTVAIAGADAVLPPGSYWLSLAGPDLADHANGSDVHPNPVTGTLAVSILPGRVTLIVLTREANGNLDLHQYSLWLGGDASAPQYSDPDWKRPITRFAALRRIELMQRTYAHGRNSPAEPDIQALLQNKWIDPVAGCLGGYMLVRTSRAEELDIPSANLSNHFPALPDSWVLRAAWFEATHGQPEMKAAVTRALDTGVPVFAQGVRRLAELASSWAADHPRTPLLTELAKKCIDGGIFSVFRPANVSALLSVPREEITAGA